MKLNTFIAAIAVAAASAVALPAVAQNVNAGTAQLSRTLGVEPGTLSLAQLVQLDQARREGGVAGNFKAEQILKSAGQERFSTSSTSPDATGRAILLERAIHEGDDFLIAQLSKDVVNNTASDRGSVSPGKAQLAALLGVNPVDYTTAELVVMQTKRDFADSSK
ncbi:hypothetical protein [Oceaniglobus ichthyenteri]|uniref:hypothetical protein n=1 Tax=Oceaniglobus ichthyenteri TaxID=2136177 RepID=UPI000D34F974|nr:hypothetical protein [Oceaniglobus ichthyenteri]